MITNDYTTSIYLLYDYRHEHNAGSKEHFFHFFWGYLLPGIREILRINKETQSSNSFVMESCGPVMDPVILEASQILSLDIKISKNVGICIEKELLVPRWDRILKLCTDWYYDRYGNGNLFPEDIVFPEEIAPQGNTFYDDIQVVRHSFLSRISLHQSDGMFFIILRTEEPEYYKAEGGAMRPTYGTFRRALTNVHETLAELSKAGYLVESYEPGKQRLADQIATFNRAHGIAAIRGAEFAHLIWMRPGSSVIMLEQPYMPGHAIQPLMAKILNLKYIGIPSKEETPYPAILPKMITPHLLTKN